MASRKSVRSLNCISCASEYPPHEIVYTCRKCGDLLEVRYDYDCLLEKLEKSDWKERPLSVWRYRELLPVPEGFKVVSLGEGGTSLHRCLRIGEVIGMRRLYVKNEGENPTGSFKDRGMTVGVTKALEVGAKAVICASTGNTASSLAAYAAKAGLASIVLVPLGKIAFGKLAQAIVYGTTTVAVKGSFDDALSLVIEASASFPFYLLNSINPFRLEGQRTAAFEIFDQLGGVPDKVVLPVGNGGNIAAYWKGFKEMKELGLTDSLPQMIGIQASGASPIADAVKKKLHKIEPVKEPETIATAIRIGNPINWKKSLSAIYESGGTAEIVTDDEIIRAQRLLASKEGIFAEPAGAASIAGLMRLVESGEIRKDETVVCVATGHGLKDMETVFKISRWPVEIEPNLRSFKEALERGVV